jgi:enoyl-CoA hydratase/carnithine racemase
MSEHILLEREGPILILRMSRVEKKNALTVGMYMSLAEWLREAGQNNNVRVLVIAGAGGVFTSGNDLHDFAATPPLSPDSPVFQFLRLLSTYPKPIVAAVNGLAVGIGTTMLLHCDLVVADPATRFSLPFINLGLVPEAASSLILPRLVGHRRASELLMLGEMFDATAAERYGIINRISAPGEAEAMAMTLARTLCTKAPMALRKTKALLKSESSAVATRMHEEAAEFATQLVSAEFREAVNAFMEKRPARFN